MKALGAGSGPAPEGNAAAATLEIPRLRESLLDRNALAATREIPRQRAPHAADSAISLAPITSVTPVAPVATTAALEAGRAVAAEYDDDLPRRSGQRGAPRRTPIRPATAAKPTAEAETADDDREWKVSYFVFAILGAFIATRMDKSSMHPYAIAALGLLTAKMALALLYRPRRAEGDEHERLARMWVTAVLPIYNEDPVMFEQGMRSLLAQTRLPDEVHVIDDHSADPAGVDAAAALAAEFEARGVAFKVSRQPENKGKREALARGFLDAPYSDVFLCVDSDTVLTPDTVRNLIAPLTDETVMASTGVVLALNHDANLLTRLQDVRYGSSFLFERAAYSQLGSVLCCCGALSAYRGTLVRKYLPDFLNQQFLGRPAVFGDDRRMTNYALMEGQVVFQQTAAGYTAVPERLPHFLRQQVRWNKSFFRESLWALRNQPLNRPAFWLTVMELGMWVVFGTAMVHSLFIVPLLHPAFFLHHLGQYAMFMVLMGYLRNVRYLDFPRRGMGLVKRFGMYLLAPVYGLVQLLLLTPLRLYALVTLAQGNWGTRQAGVEVSVPAT